MAFNFEIVRSADQAEYIVKHPQTGEDTEWVFIFSGPSHERAIKQRNDTLRRALKRTRTNKQPSESDIIADGVEFVIARCLGWKGATVEYSEDALRRLLNDPAYGWLSKQLNEFLGDDASFINNSATA